MTPLDKPRRAVARVTLGALGFGHGRDRNRRLVAQLAYGDLLVLRPQGTRRPQTVALVDVYTWALKCKVNRDRMEKLRQRKAQLEQRRALARLRRPLRAGKE
jgi:hypothetical protein